MNKPALAVLALAFTSFLAACGDDAMDYTCTVTWTVGGTDTTEATLDYSSLPSAADAVEMCGDDQAAHADRPVPGAGESIAYQCDCDSK